MRSRTFSLLLLAGALAAPAGAHAADRAPGEVVVARTTSATAASPQGPRFEVLKVKDVDAAVRRLRRRGDVRYAVPNVRARASAFTPNDPGRGKGWTAVQWNFAGPFGINAPQAWQHLIDAGRPGGRGVVVAVLDTGVAYRRRGRDLKSYDINKNRITRGYDFVDGDPYATDRNGHGTHVASTIAESTNNGKGLTGLAYGATIMPVRVLDDEGEGDASDIAKGIRYAARRGADVINLSLEFSSDVTAREIPQLLDAISYARRKRAIVVGASGNEAGRAVAFPARASHVISVGSTTERGCLSDFSNQGTGLDIVGPGGGADAFLPFPECQPDAPAGRNITQVTLVGDRRRFGMPNTYQGTSMAVPHVSAAAALIIASGVVGERPTPGTVERRLKATARDLGDPGPDPRYGAGLLDAAAATNPAIPAT